MILFLLNVNVTYELGPTQLILFLAVIAFIIFKLRDRRLKKSKDELEQIVEERTAALKHNNALAKPMKY